MRQQCPSHRDRSPSCLHRAAAALFVAYALAGAATPLSGADSLGLTSLDAAPPPGTPVIPWVAVGDSTWQGGPPTFEISDATSDLRATGHLAITTEAILWHVVVQDREHLNATDAGGGGAGSLYQGDSLQLAVDALGQGSELPNDKDGYALRLDRHGGDYGVMLSSATHQSYAFSFYSGLGHTGPKPALHPLVVRDEGAHTTTYDFGIPWSDLDAAAGIAPTLRVALQVNDSNADWKKQHRIWWGGGVGGRFVPALMQRLAIGPPPVPVAVVLVTRPYLGDADAPGEITVALTGSATLAASAGTMTTTLGIGGSDQALRRYAVRFAPEHLHGSAMLGASLTRAGSVLGSASVRIFSESASQWYPFKPTDTPEDGVIGLSSWLDAPAGKHGFVQAKGGALVCEDGTPIQLWGVDRHGCVPPHDHHQADLYAQWWAKMGINAVVDKILFAVGWEGIGDPNDTTKTVPGELDDYDYHCASLTMAGIYHSVSAFWGEQLRPADKPKVLNWAEAQGHAPELENFAADIQDLHIAAVVNWLNHTNKYTGKTNAEDTSLTCVTIRNEQDIYFYNVSGALQACPTYRARVRKHFCDWLRARYHDEAGLRSAWGDRCFGMWGCDKDESLDANTLSPLFNAWFFSNAGLEDQDRGLKAKRRLLDCCAFLREVQTSYYQRFADAIRATGYRGMIIGSDWQAADGIGHLSNLMSDRAVGPIDRHNYFGGAGGNNVTTCGTQDDSSMLWQPGRALLSTGMQRLADRPFGMSEWNIGPPNEWRAEGPVIMGFYGMGLQGWSMLYQSFGNYAGFSPTIADRGTQVYNAESPSMACLYNTVMRALLRGDIARAPVVVSRRFSLQDLGSGTLNFDDQARQSGDVKEFGGTPVEALAAGGVQLELVDHSTPSLLCDLAASMEKKTIVSNTGQLSWHYAAHDDAYITIDSPGTAGVAGFTPKQALALGPVTIALDNRFAVLLVTALGRHETLADAKRVLVTAFARERNTGMVIGEAHDVSTLGTAPLLLEPVVATVTFARAPSAVHLLDHDGRMTGRLGTLSGTSLDIDGARDRAVYYAVDFP